MKDFPTSCELQKDCRINMYTKCKNGRLQLLISVYLFSHLTVLMQLQLHFNCHAKGLLSSSHDKKLCVSVMQLSSEFPTMDQSLSGGRGQVSVLSCFPPSVGRDIAVAVVKPLGAGLGNPGTRSLLCTDKQVSVTSN